MPSIKSTPVRVLRSKITTRPVLRGVNRGITGTAKIASPWEIPQTTVLPPSLPSVFHRPQPIYQPAYPSKTPFDDLLNSLTQSLSTTSKPAIKHLMTLLRAYPSNPDHWSRFAHRNPQKQYTRNLVCELPGIFNLLMLVWTPGQASPVHDHADSHCLMKILKGELQETRYAMPQHHHPSPSSHSPGALQETSRLKFGVDKVTYIADSLGLHEISNPHPTDYAVSLHLYTPPNAALRGCRVFDTETGVARHVMQCPYDSEGGVVCAER